MAKILVVDDAAFMRMRVVKLLTENGYEVIEAGDGKEGVDKYLAEKPDLVLMDITMPVMDGIAAVQEIKKHDPNAIIVMLSALGQQTMVMNSIKAGAKDFIVKPYQPDKILSTIKRFIG
ncbi:MULTISPECIES: response regulator [Carboxydocella]|uniref:Stage 0 sporulation protein A homolog n=2 Tax=Carboxydocella TaxID=178898 RepID=A0A1T4QKR7_9FIRM|nr:MULTISPECIES: response regulator [Carboxydocella]AVX19256.1 two-component system, chemotaxis family, response regulator CheY [Carboxydocella thermautotrophica]AVX29669.1 two-component system, chemotaxis family, response regulator CheY [Carboxydocella thermautotrophica]SKA03848.1 two-component system, chemotaxis family, response regulator CheY [Carboxydocella sporoproducens DSM 16521]GAW29867.1 response regulator [Carboxydocella sp. ULO1]GAW32876.1 response regulator [Carboxydocella sp. JDF6